LRCDWRGGLSIEDATGSNTPLFESELAIERIKAARRAIDDSGLPVILTGRCEAFSLGRLIRCASSWNDWWTYADAGADCLYAPGVSEPDQITAIVKAVAPKPVNVLMPIGRAARCRCLNSKISACAAFQLDRALARVAWGAFIRAARGISRERIVRRLCRRRAVHTSLMMFLGNVCENTSA